MDIFSLLFMFFTLKCLTWSSWPHTYIRFNRKEGLFGFYSPQLLYVDLIPSLHILNVNRRRRIFKKERKKVKVFNFEKYMILFPDPWRLHKLNSQSKKFHKLGLHESTYNIFNIDSYIKAKDTHHLNKVYLRRMCLNSSTTTNIWLVHAIRCGSKNWHQNYMCLKKIGPRVQNMLTILGSVIHMIRNTYMAT